MNPADFIKEVSEKQGFNDEQTSELRNVCKQYAAKGVETLVNHIMRIEGVNRDDQRTITQVAQKVDWK